VIVHEAEDAAELTIVSLSVSQSVSQTVTLLNTPNKNIARKKTTAGSAILLV